MTQTAPTATTTQAAALAQVTPRTIRRWAAAGRVTATKTNGRWAIDIVSLTAVLAHRIAQHADLTPYKDKARAYDKVVQLLEDQALVPTHIPGVYTAISSDGTDKYLVDAHASRCDCRSWLGRQYCSHLTTAQAIEAAHRPALTLAA